MLFEKRNGKLQLFFDYWVLNDITDKNHDPLPLIQKTLFRIAKAKWFTLFDLHAECNLIRVAEE